MRVIDCFDKRIKQRLKCREKAYAVFIIFLHTKHLTFYSVYDILQLY